MNEYKPMMGEWSVSPDELPNTKVGRIMWDIIFIQNVHCKDKAAYLALTKATAKEIIGRLK